MHKIVWNNTWKNYATFVQVQCCPCLGFVVIAAFYT